MLVRARLIQGSGWIDRLERIKCEEVMSELCVVEVMCYDKHEFLWRTVLLLASKGSERLEQLTYEMDTRISAVLRNSKKGAL